jgi:hypothetical protein
MTTFYKNGNVKTKESYKNGIPDGKYISYYNTGSVFEVNLYEDGKINGIARQFTPNGKLLKEYYYIQGVRSILVKYNNDSLPKRYYIFKIDTSGNLNQIGQVIYDNYDNIDNSKSFYCNLSIGDTLCIGEKSTFEIQGYNLNQPDYNMEVVFSNSQNLFTFPDTGKVIKLNVKGLSINYSIIPKNLGVNNLYGYVILKQKDSKLGYQFPVLKEFYVINCRGIAN